MNQDGGVAGAAGLPPASPPPANAPKLPDSSKHMLRLMAEELLQLHGQAEAAEARALQLQEQLTALQQQQAAAAVNAAPVEVQDRVSQLEQQVREQQQNAQLSLQREQQAHVQSAQARMHVAGLEAQLKQQQAAAAELQLQLAAAQQAAAGFKQQAADWGRQLEQHQTSESQQAEQLQSARDALRLQHQQLEDQQRQREELRAACDTWRSKAEASAALEIELQEDLQRQQQELEQLRQQVAQQLAAPGAAWKEGELEGQQQEAKQRAPSPAAADAANAGTAAAVPAAVNGGRSVLASSAEQDISRINPEEQHGQPEVGGAGNKHPAQPPSSAGQLAKPRGEASEPLVAAAAAAAAAAGQGGAMQPPPPPQRLAGLAGPMQQPRKPKNQGSAAALHAAASRKRQVAEVPDATTLSPRTRQRRRKSAAPLAAGSGGTQPSTSPGESAFDAAVVLRRGLRQRPSAAASATPRSAVADVPGSPAADGAGDLLLSLQAAAQEQAREDGADDGSRRRSVRRSTSVFKAVGGGVSGGGILLKPEETAQQWLNRSALAYVQAMLRNQEFREVFGKPVPQDTPEYLNVIAHPMDLGTIRDKAAAGEYQSPAAFRADLELVVSNAITFNQSHKHPVHQAAERLQDQLHKPHNFFTKVDEQFQRAELSDTIALEKQQQEAELEAMERQLAAQVDAGLNVAVYAEDDEQRNKYFLLKALGKVSTLPQDTTDDFGQEYKAGDHVLEGYYYEYWKDAKQNWDRSKRPYYLMSDKMAFVPASSLLLVDFELKERPKPELSLFDGKEHCIFEANAELHQQLRQQIKKMTATV